MMPPADPGRFPAEVYPPDRLEGGSDELPRTPWERLERNRLDPLVSPTTNITILCGRGREALLMRGCLRGRAEPVAQPATSSMRQGGSSRETHLIGPLGGVGAPDRARVLGRAHG